MQPLQALSNKEKAILLHKLLPGEIRGLLAGLHHYAQQTIKEIAENKVLALPVPISVDSWQEYAQYFEKTIDTQINTLCASPLLFAEELFTGDKEAFSLDYLPKHAAITGYRFRDAIKFLFDLKPYGKLPFQEDEK